MYCEYDKYLVHLHTREIIQGDTCVFAYQFTDQDGGVIIPTSSQFSWKLCTYDYYDEAVITISAGSSQITVDSSTGIIYLTLTASNTSLLENGKYIQQPILTYNSTPYIRAWGEIIVRRKVGGV